MSVVSVCLFEGCARPHWAKGYCNSHYTQLRTTGKVRKLRERLPADVKFWRNVIKTDTCWNWKSPGKSGYGSIRANGRAYGAHRFSLILHGIEIPSGMVVDHMCHNKSCVNPDHLQVVTPAQNAQNLKGATAKSSTGVRGVSAHGKKYRATVGAGGRLVHVGTYGTVEEAGQAAARARNELHTNNLLDRGFLDERGQYSSKASE